MEYRRYCVTNIYKNEKAIALSRVRIVTSISFEGGGGATGANQNSSKS